ncbi:MAG TPA: deoxyribonuclease IV [Phycisphaerales bacterium]|nr:deoxyribonuclease IV [Phycisphaerales bacterium]
MIGSHLSVAGGMHNALLEAEALKLDCVQVFTKNQRQWKIKPLADEAVDLWLAELQRLGWDTPEGPSRSVSHASYLINLASPDADLWNKSIDLMQIEIERCDQLHIPLLVHHPGAYTTGTEAGGLKNIAKACKILFKRTNGAKVVVCLENTVGSGSNLGRTFDQLGQLRAMICDTTGEPERVGFCFDTCHAHAGGYDMSSREAADAALDEFDARCGLEFLHVLHLNDSKGDLASRKDRHEHIGDGTLGFAGGVSGGKKLALGKTGFAAVVNRPELANRPMIMETPKGENPKGTPWDTINARRLRRLVEPPRAE